MVSRVWQQALWVTAGAVVLAGACSKRSGPPPLPPIPKLAEAPAARNLDDLDYRSKPGESIAPVVVADDPAPVAVAAQALPAGGKGPATLNGDPAGLTREALNQSIQGAMGSLASCLSSMTQDPMVAVSFEADPSGRPSLLRIQGAPPDAERCMRNVVQGIRFPAFQGKGVQVDLPLSFHRVGKTAQAAAPAQPAEQQGAPLFLQP